MKIMWKPKSAKADDIIATVVNTAALSVVGVANGRTVPVVILQPDDENKIDAVITAHSGISEGNCESQWDAPMTVTQYCFIWSLQSQ